MSTPSPYLSAAAPSLITVLQEFQTFTSTVLTGDPVLALARFIPAADIFLGQITLQLPGLAVAELGAANTALNAKVGELIAKLQPLVKP